MKGQVNMNSIKTDVQQLVQKELNSANKKFPLFNSPHEGYAVIKEEVDECDAEMRMIFETILPEVWSKIKTNKKPFNLIRMVKNAAEKLAIEAIQVAAMCDKYNMSLATDVEGGELNNGNKDIS